MTNYVSPPFLLNAVWQQSTEIAWYDTVNSAGDPMSIAYKWVLYAYLPATQKHNNPNTPTPGEYNALDVKPGMWICNRLMGMAVRVISVKTEHDPLDPAYPDDPITDPNNLYCEVEDVDYFNSYANPSGRDGGVANTPDVPLIIFEVTEEGFPVLTGVPDQALPAPFQSDLMGRFADRNLKMEHIRVYQPSHTFVPGDVIRLMPSGSEVYELAPADENVGLSTGIIQDVGIPTDDWFSFRPFGRVVENLAVLLTGTPGTLFYIDPAHPGKLTSTKPASFARPVYMRLNSNNRAVLLETGAGVGGQGAGVSKQQLFIPTDGQTDFVITDTTVGSILYIAVNGIEDDNFTFTRSTRTVSIDTSESGIGYTLDHNDEVLITYVTN